MPESELMGGSSPTGLTILIAELAITVADSAVWLSIGLAIFTGGVCLGLGTWVARTVGLLSADAPRGEVIGVGLGAGLMVSAAWWAAIWSGGRSSFTPVAIGFAVAIAVAVAQGRRDRVAVARTPRSSGSVRWSIAETLRAAARAAGAKLLLGSSLFVIVAAVVYGSTLAPSPRDGVQPVAFSDVAYYSVLGRDLATTGTETNLGPSGFSDLPGTPSQTWYHWAELWLASAAITIFGAAPIAARHFIVLPLVLLAAAALTGTLVRRVSGTTSNGAFLFGFVACLFLAPVGLPGPFFSSWAAGLFFGITLYGMAAVALLFALYCIAVLRSLRPTLALALFVGSAGAFIVPAHIVIATLALVGLTCTSAIDFVHALVARGRLPSVSRTWAATGGALALLVVATGVWGVATGHGLGGSQALRTVRPFNDAWQLAIASTYLGAGTFWTIFIGLVLYRRTAPAFARLCFGVLVILVSGALAWGARLDDFNMFHVFFGGLAVFAVPVAAVAAWTIYGRLRVSGRMRLGYSLAALCAVHLAVSVASTTVRLQEFGPRLHNEPIADSLLRSISELPADARLAYACRPFEEFSFVDSSLLSIDAHTGRRVVPMCFQADVFSSMNGSRIDPRVPAAGFGIAPQSALFPDATARPSVAAIEAFLQEHGIGYLYVDAEHPNTLVPGAAMIASSERAAVLRVP